MEKERERQGRGAVKEWASMEALRYMAGVARTRAEWEILALAALSCAHCLRASEAVTAHVEGSELVFQGTKSRSGEQRQEMGQWTAKWAAFLARLRASHGYHPDVPAWFQGTDGLHRGLHGILDRPGGSFKYLRWHSFRRFGATQLHGLGLPVRFIMLWGVEVGGSGGDILQGAAAMAVCARGTHPPARVRGERNDGADAARDNVGNVAKLDQERARGPPCATCSGRTESGGQFCPGAEKVPDSVAQARRGRNRRLARATAIQDRQTPEGGDTRGAEETASGQRRQRQTGRRSGRRCTGLTGARGG